MDSFRWRSFNSHRPPYVAFQARDFQAAVASTIMLASTTK